MAPTTGAAATTPRPPRSPFPPYAADAATFADLFDAYLYSWPAVACEVYTPRWPTSQVYAEYLLRLAQRVATEFPAADPWDHLEPALRRAMAGYDPHRGPFDTLFGKTLRERLRKAEARAAVKNGHRQRAERAYALTHSTRGDPDDTRATFRRWAGVLLDRACDRLDPNTQTYLRMRRAGEPVAAVAAVLGVAERSLNNRYGGSKGVGKVRAAVRQVVLDLPSPHRRLLARHLREEAGLTPGQVGRLLQVPVAVDGTVPLMEEGQLLTELGWAGASDDFSRCGAATTGGDREYVL